MIAHCVSVKVVRIKVASLLPTLKHSVNDLGILKLQQALGGNEMAGGLKGQHY